MLDSIGRPQRLVTDQVPFVPTPLNGDDDARTAQIAAEAGTKIVRSAPADPARPGHATTDDLPRQAPIASDEHDGRGMVQAAPSQVPAAG